MLNNCSNDSKIDLVDEVKCFFKDFLLQKKVPLLVIFDYTNNRRGFLKKCLTPALHIFFYDSILGLIIKNLPKDQFGHVLYR